MPSAWRARLRAFLDVAPRDRKQLETASFFVAGAAVVLLLNRAVRDLVFGMTLPNELYARPVIFLAALESWKTLAFVTLSTAVLLVFHRRVAWHGFERPRVIRGFVFAVAAPLAWSYSTYDFNAFYNQPHLVDRLLLVVLCLALLKHPAALPAFLTLAYAIPAQLEGDVPAYVTWNDKKLLYNVLILFTAYLAWKIVRGRSLQVFVYLLLCLIAANYFAAGSAKVAMGWLAENHLPNIIASAHVNGWFFYDRPETALAWLAAAEVAAKPLMVAALFIELAAICILLRRRTTILIVAGFIVLHVMIFLTTGVFFWKWIWLDVAVIGLLSSLGGELSRRVFTWPGLALSLVLIPWADAFLDPFAPAWFDTRLNTLYRMEGVGESGERYAVEMTFFAPYDTVFVQNRFYFLSRDRHLVNTYGTAADREVSRALDTVGPDPAAVAEIETRLGMTHYDPKKIARFDAFVRRYLSNLNRRGEKKIVPVFLSAPRHLWTYLPTGPHEVFSLQEPIRRLEVFQLKTYYDGARITLLERRRVHAVDVPAG